MDNSCFKAPVTTRILVLLLCVIGIFISLDLAKLHYQVYTDPDFQSFCAINDSFNCETVAESPYSIFFGLPVAVWGVLGYLLMTGLSLLLIFSKKRESIHALFLALSSLSVLVSIALAIISYCIICSICILCSATYIINIITFFLLLFSIRFREFPWADTLSEAKLFIFKRWPYAILGLILLALLVAFYPKYWEKKLHKHTDISMSANTLQGSPWIGGTSPVLTIVEYSDYMCPFCGRGHINLRQQIQKYAGKIKMYHRHFPLDEACNPIIDSPFHPGACLMARAAYCAGEQNKFWEMNDRFVYNGFSRDRNLEHSLFKVAESISLDIEDFKNCLNSERANQAVKEDIEAALKLNIRGTPSLVIDNQVHLGALPPEIFSKLDANEQE